MLVATVCRSVAADGCEGSGNFAVEVGAEDCSASEAGTGCAGFGCGVVAGAGGGAGGVARGVRLGGRVGLATAAAALICCML